jgi:hypothetical protein
MRYSNAGEIVVIAVVWVVILLVVKNAFDTPAASETVHPTFTTPQIETIIRHIGCSEQYKEVVRVLKTLPWLEEPQIMRGDQVAKEIGEVPAVPAPHTLGTVRPEQPLELCAVRIAARVKSVEQADFVQLTEALRDIGIVPVTLEFGGLQHFALQAQMADLSCQPCVQTAMDALSMFPVSATYYYSTTKNPIEVSKQTSFQWLESKGVDTSRHTITVSVRPQHTARVVEMMRAFERSGLLPLAIRVVDVKA